MVKNHVLHPYLFSIFSILFLYANNISQTSASELLLPLALTLASTFIIWFILKSLLKDSKKAGIIVSVGLILFFSYGHIFSAIYAKYKILHHYHLVPFEFLIFLFLSYKVFKASKRIEPISKFLNNFTIILVLLPLFTIGNSLLHKRNIVTYKKAFQAVRSITASDKTGVYSPDIYYIILDGYANNHTLKRYYNHDNSDFVNFPVAE